MAVVPFRPDDDTGGVRRAPSRSVSRRPRIVGSADTFERYASGGMSPEALAAQAQARVPQLQSMSPQEILFSLLGGLGGGGGGGGGYRVYGGGGGSGGGVAHQALIDYYTRLRDQMGRWDENNPFYQIVEDSRKARQAALADFEKGLPDPGVIMLKVISALPRYSSFSQVNGLSSVPGGGVR